MVALVMDDRLQSWAVGADAGPLTSRPVSQSEINMNETSKERESLEGPLSWANWRAMRAGAPTLGAVEFPLYSDAWTTGEVTTGVGPYQFFNAVPMRHGHGIVRSAVVVRLEIHMNFDSPDPDRTDPGVYHGGGLVDELAALASLFTGARFRAGGQSRRFGPRDGPRGRPIAWDTRPEPTLSVSLHGGVLPTCGGEHSLMPLEQLTIHPDMDPRDAIALIRAARLYQDALWMAESEPNLAWIMLVSAVEAVANRWHTSPRSTWKFIAFLIAHFPPHHHRRDRQNMRRSHGTKSRCGGHFASSTATDRKRYTRAFHFLRVCVNRLVTVAGA